MRVRGGVIAELGEPGTLEPRRRQEMLEGDGRLRLLPAFFDPHVHLRTPGQEHKEDLETGTRAAAAGGYGGGASRCPTPTRCSTRRRCLRSLRDAAARAGARPGRLPAPRSPAAWKASS